METKILITRRIHRDAVELLRQHFNVRYIDNNEQIDPGYLKNNIGEFDGILTAISDRIDGGLLCAGRTKLKAVSNMAAGVDNIDVEAAELLGIKVFNTPDVVTGSTADFTIALALTSLRKTVEARQYVLDNKWKQWDPGILLGRSLAGLNWGLVGFGRIGRAVAKRLSGFDTKVYYAEKDRVQPEPGFSATRLSFDELLAACDVISIHVPLTDETRNMFDMQAFVKMKKKPLLINISRGDIVNTGDLIFALENNLVSGVALDVVEKEPIRADHPLLTFGNVLMTPHIGTATLECRREMAMMAASNLVDFFNRKTYDGRELERHFSEAV